MATSSSARGRRPAPGDILFYGYLWSDQAEAGRDDPIKERPCVIVLSVGEGDHPQIVVAPITSREPANSDAIPLSTNVPGLDRRSWIIPWELNAFRWPGPDIGRAPQPAGAWWRVGALTPALRILLADRVEAALKVRHARVTRRTE